MKRILVESLREMSRRRLHERLLQIMLRQMTGHAQFDPTRMRDVKNSIADHLNMGMGRFSLTRWIGTRA